MTTLWQVQVACLSYKHQLSIFKLKIYRKFYSKQSKYMLPTKLSWVVHSMVVLFDFMCRQQRFIKCLKHAWSRSIACMILFFLKNLSNFKWHIWYIVVLAISK